MGQANGFAEMPASDQRLVRLQRELQEATNLFLAKMQKLEKLLYSIEE